MWTSSSNYERCGAAPGPAGRSRRRPWACPTEQGSRNQTPGKARRQAESQAPPKSSQQYSSSLTDGASGFAVVHQNGADQDEAYGPDPLYEAAHRKLVTYRTNTNLQPPRPARHHRQNSERNMAQLHQERFLEVSKRMR